MNKSLSLLGVLFALLVVVPGCASSHMDEPDAALPVDVRADYAVFALRCSKCHSLARPLNSGIDNDQYWKMYVERMRRQPASGISVADTVPILRFLHAYSVAERKRKGESLDVSAPLPTQTDAALAPEPAPPPPETTPDAGTTPTVGGP